MNFFGKALCKYLVEDLQSQWKSGLDNYKWKSFSAIKVKPLKTHGIIINPDFFFININKIITVLIYIFILIFPKIIVFIISCWLHPKIHPLIFMNSQIDTNHWDCRSPRCKYLKVLRDWILSWINLITNTTKRVIWTENRLYV